MNREILPSMLERNCGHIVAMSSLSSMAGVANISTYTVSKWGINGKYFTINLKISTIKNLNV